MAYAALLSLSQSLDQILVHDQYLHPLEKEKLISLQGNVTTILTFLQDHSHNNEINLSETQIIDTSYQLEDIIKSKLSSIYLSLHDNEADFFSENLQSLTKELHKYTFQPHSVAIPAKPLVINIENNGPEGTNTMVGFDHDEYLAIRSQMYHNSSEFKIIPIVGMGGIGKSTLARRLFEDSIRRQYFDKCAWVVVSQEYSSKEILLGVLRSIKKTDDNLSENNVSELIQLIHKELYDRRYLLVLDDVWSEKALDDLNMIMPNNANGSCVLLTTRLSKVATYVTSTLIHEMRLLSEHESWILLKQNVFGTRSVPSELEIIGQEIAKECRGLPLTVAVVAGLLKGNIAIEYWESISHNISSREPTIELRCSKVLSLSYDHLPIHLKPCFLYVTTFPEDSRINANRLIRLWMAEGFVKASGSKCLEEVAEEYLDDLVGRSILQASKRRYNGRIKTIVIHDLVRDVGTLKAREERFCYHGLPETVGYHNLKSQVRFISDDIGFQDTFISDADLKAQEKRRTVAINSLRDFDISKSQEESNHRRLSIHTKDSLDCLQYLSNPTTCSLLICLLQENVSPPRISNFTMLSVLDANVEIEEMYPENLVHSRYLAFKNDRPDRLQSWFNLPNLQTLDIQGYFDDDVTPLFVPFEIWTIPSLRHLILPERSYLEQPKFEHNEETNLVTLSVASSLKMTIHATKMLANLQRLGLLYSGVDQLDWKNSQFSNIVHLQKLEKLKLIIPSFAQVKLAFPLTLKKLRLEDFERPWTDMNIVGSLPNLEVLKLWRGHSTGHEVWSPIDGQFLKLKYLELVSVRLPYWEAESFHFPSLEILVLGFMEGLKEIPGDIGEIDTLKLIKLSLCEQVLVDSALQIQADQQEMGNHELQVIISDTLDEMLG